MKKIIVVLLTSAILFNSFKYNLNATELNSYTNKEYKVELMANDEAITQEDIMSGLEAYTPGFGESQSCEKVLGSSLKKFLKTLRITMQGVSAGLTIALGMIAFIPAITSGDQNALKKAIDTFVKTLVVLALILLFPTLIRFIGHLCGFDLSCI